MIVNGRPGGGWGDDEEGRESCVQVSLGIKDVRGDEGEDDGKLHFEQGGVLKTMTFDVSALKVA